MKRTLALACLIVGIGTLGGAGQEKTEDVTLRVVKYDGLKEVLLKNRGNVVFVDFWADFCLECKQKFPHVMDLHKKHAKEGLAIVTVALDDLKESPQAKDNALKFLKKQGATFTNLLLDEPVEFWQKKFRMDGPPHVYVFSRQGKWTSFDSQFLTNEYDKVDRLIEELLKEK